MRAEKPDEGVRQTKPFRRPRLTAGIAVRNGNGVPSTLGRYQVLKELGRGAMGVVYLGKIRRSSDLWPLKPCGWTTSTGKKT